ncbi:hypothetical protein V493_08075 [Pseudogymnoascus sp. VKM F-4281 (FW-2241)]|nr:hypothetical protein V493_08075 [Pseudogymnoascus sp. VKM F-4281 (FW-2241)]
MTYCIWSLSKILVATAAIILIDQTPGIVALKDAWDYTIYKHLRIQLRSDGTEPTISYLFSHTSGIPSVNDFLLGLDGNVMLSEDSFIHMVEKISQERNPALRAINAVRGGIVRLVPSEAGVAAVMAYNCGVVLEHGEEVEADRVDERVCRVCGGEAENGEDEGDDGEAKYGNEDVALVFVDLEFSEEGEGD